MNQPKRTNLTEVVQNSRLDLEEPILGRQLLIGLQHHVQIQHVMSSRRVRQNLVIWISVIAAIVTVIVAVKLA
ncbi:hypothetical protein ACFQRK_14165 [Parapedobacter sp. GCM10030251]|jgi:hypothetical protein|uniref:hypothetical protein n=1 Tax=Parapedobacter sp. GCM10030251 TaxID=3273419 RepID=UPI00361E3342